MQKFWLTHALWPGTVFLALFAVIEVSAWDLNIADQLFYQWSEHRWIGAHTWWAADVIHTGGRTLVQCVALGALLSAVFKPTWRRDAIYVFLVIGLSTGVVGLLKHSTNVDCPWDLARYGGAHPYVQLFADRPDNLPKAACFPGAHSSSGFSLMCLYFVLRVRGRRGAAGWALAGAIFLGALFSFGQQARGAHFLSHDLTSAAIAWGIALVLSSSTDHVALSVMS